MEIISNKITHVYEDHDASWFHPKYSWSKLPQGTWMANPISHPRISYVNEQNTHKMHQQLREFSSAGVIKCVDANGSYTNNRTPIIQIDNWQPNLASQVFDVVSQSGIFDIVEHKGQTYRLVGCSNHFFHLYCSQGGEHFPHIDGADSLDSQHLKIMAVLIHWTSCNSGEFAIVHPRNDNFGNKIREWTDRQADHTEIQAMLQPNAGRLYVFPNDTCCHAVMPFTDEGGLRMSSRGDLIYQRI